MTGALRIQAWKELRVLLPWWGAMVITLLVLGRLTSVSIDSLYASSMGIGVCVYIIGSISLAAMSIGHEYSYRALPALLAQPSSRSRVLATKLGVLAALLAVLAVVAISQLVWVAPNQWRPLVVKALLVLPPVVALLLTPWLTMVSRGPLAGAVFSVALPVILYLIGTQTETRPPYALGFAVKGSMVLAAVGGVLTWWTFLRLEAIDGPHAEVGVPTWMRRRIPAPEWSSARMPVARHQIWMLVRKELRLQQMTVFVAVVYVLLWAAVATGRTAVPGFIGLSFGVVTTFYCGVVSLMAGAIASAEERQLSTAEWQALLPLAAWKQWTLKVGTAFGLALAFGLILPLVLAVIPTTVETLPFDVEWAFAIMIICTGALYVSSLNTSGMRAFLATFPTIAGVVMVGALILGPLSTGASAILGPIARDISPFSDLPRRTVSQVMTLGVMTPLVIGFGLVMLAFAGRNHRSADRSGARIRQQILWMLVYAIGAVLVMSFATDMLEAGLR